MGSAPTFAEIVNYAIDFINLVITALFAAAFLVMIWKLIDAWIIHADEEESREQGRTIALTAVLVMVLMASIWGILRILQGGL